MHISAHILEIKAENCMRRRPLIPISAKSISEKPFQLAQTVRKLVPRRPFRFKKLDAISAEKSWRLWRIQP